MNTTIEQTETTERPILFSGAMVRAILEGRKGQTRRVVKRQPNPEHWQNKITCEIYEPIVLRRGMQVPGAPVFGFASEDEGWVCPYGQPGERLWVKETFCPKQLASVPTAWIYRADNGPRPLAGWKPSIFMPRKLSRITLEIEAVRVERLQDISETDAMAEGAGKCFMDKTHPRFENGKMHTAIEDYQILWNSINLKPSPNYVTLEGGKKAIVSYQSFPWSNADFDEEYPGVRETGLYRNKPIVVTENPWVWILEFKRVEVGEKS